MLRQGTLENTCLPKVLESTHLAFSIAFVLILMECILAFFRFPLLEKVPVEEEEEGYWISELKGKGGINPRIEKNLSQNHISERMARENDKINQNRYMLPKPARLKVCLANEVGESPKNGGRTCREIFFIWRDDDASDASFDDAHGFWKG